MPGKIISSLDCHNEQKHFFQILTEAKNTIQQVFEYEEVGSSEAIRTSFVAIKEKMRNDRNYGQQRYYFSSYSGGKQTVQTDNISFLEYIVHTGL